MDGAECYTMTELHQKMIEMANSTTLYTTKWLKAKLIEKYKEHMYSIQNVKKVSEITEPLHIPIEQYIQGSRALTSIKLPV